MNADLKELIELGRRLEAFAAGVSPVSPTIEVRLDRATFDALSNRMAAAADAWLATDNARKRDCDRFVVSGIAFVPSVDHALSIPM